MIVRRYYGETVEEATEAARRDLGPHVVVLLTKRLSEDPTDRRVEVVVAVEAQSVRNHYEVEFPPRPPVRSRSTPSKAGGEEVAFSLRERSSVSEPLREPIPQVGAPGTSSLERLRTQQARNAYGGSPTRSGYRPPMVQLLRERLEEQEVEEELIQLFVQELGPAEPEGEEELTVAREVLRRGLAKNLPIAEERHSKKKTTVLAFVGPTGVGKTTTIAKLAARAHLSERRPVRLVTVDTYRIAGAEQLKVYGRILGVPCHVAMTPVELSEIVSRAEPDELLFLDTPGRSPQNRSQLLELRNLLDAVERDETYLLVSGTTRNADLWEVVRGFHPLHPNRLIFTKLDEATTFGNIVNFTYRQRMPLAYFTTGQTVPDDIESVSPEKLARLLLRGRRSLFC